MFFPTSRDASYTALQRVAKQNWIARSQVEEVGFGIHKIVWVVGVIFYSGLLWFTLVWFGRKWLFMTFVASLS